MNKQWLLMQYLYNSPLTVTDHSLNPGSQKAEQSAYKTSLVGIAKMKVPAK